MTRRVRIVGAAMLVVVPLLAIEAALGVAVSLSRTARIALMPVWKRNPPIVPDDRLGFRGNPYHRDHDDAGYRNAARLRQADIVVLGDSHAYGSGVATREAWPHRLALRPVYNMALPNQSAGQGLLQLNDALALRPRLVIMAPYFGNDFVDIYLLARRHPALLAGIEPSLLEAAREADRRLDLERRVAEAAVLRSSGDAGAPAAVGGVRSWVSNHLKLYALARAIRSYPIRAEAPALLSRKFASASAALTPDQRRYAFPVDAGSWRTIVTPAYRGRALDARDPRIAVGFQATIRALRDAEERCRTAGVAMLVVLLPTKESVFWPRVPAAAAPRELAELVANEMIWRRRLLDALTAGRIEHMDLLDALRAAPTQPYFEDVDGHPNGAGHGIIAAAVAVHARRLLD